MARVADIASLAVVSMDRPARWFLAASIGVRLEYPEELSHASRREIL